MRAVAILGLATMALLAGAAAPQRAAADCIYVVVRNDVVYVQTYDPRVHIERGAPLNGVEAPDCADTGGPRGGPTAVESFHIPGLSPEVAFLAGTVPVVAHGYLVEALPLGLSGRPADETVGCELRPPVSFTGRGHWPGLTGFGVNVDESMRPVVVGPHHFQGVFVDRKTRVEGLSRHGVPFIGEGQRIRVDAVPCHVSGARGSKIVARRIVATGAIVGQTTAADILGENWRGGSFVQRNRTSLLVVLLAALCAAAFTVLLRVMRPVDSS